MLFKLAKYNEIYNIVIIMDILRQTTRMIKQGKCELLQQRKIQIFNC